MGYDSDAADMNPHGSTGDCDRLSRGQCSPQLGPMISSGLEVHMNAINQRQTRVSEFVVEVNRVVLPRNSVQARRVGHTEGEVEGTLACGRRHFPNAFVARELHEQETWPFRSLVEGRKTHRHDVSSSSELHHLGPREPTEPVPRDRVGIPGPPLSLIAHYRIIQVLVEHPSGFVASCMVESPIVSDLVKYRLPSLRFVIELRETVPPHGSRGKGRGNESVPGCKHQRIFVKPCSGLCLICL